MDEYWESVKVARERVMLSCEWESGHWFHIDHVVEGVRLPNMRRSKIMTAVWWLIDDSILRKDGNFLQFIPYSER